LSGVATVASSFTTYTVGVATTCCVWNHESSGVTRGIVFGDTATHIFIYYDSVFTCRGRVIQTGFSIFNLCEWRTCEKIIASNFTDGVTDVSPEDRG